MAVYKVIQDVEAEDKLLGPLTLKQFIYAAIALLLAFISFRLLLTPEIGMAIRAVVILLLLGPMVLFGVLASPLGRDQPTEIWLLSRVRFLLKSRWRIWDQSGTVNLVTITAPKKIEKQAVKDISQTEVYSRLQALASTLDSRGWAVKNANVNLYGQPGYFESEDAGSDRLVGADTLPQNVPAIDVRPEDDIMDPQNNTTAHHFNELIEEAEQRKKQRIAQKMESARAGTEPPIAQDFWFMHQSDALNSVASGGQNTVFQAPTIIAPGASSGQSQIPVQSVTNDISSDATKALLDRLHKQQAVYSKIGDNYSRRMKKIMTPAEQQRIVQEAAAARQAAVTAAQQAVKMDLAQSGNDLSVSSIASLVNRKSSAVQTGPNEVTISLH